MAACLRVLSAMLSAPSLQKALCGLVRWFPQHPKYCFLLLLCSSQVSSDRLYQCYHWEKHESCFSSSQLVQDFPSYGNWICPLKITNLSVILRGFFCVFILSKLSTKLLRLSEEISGTKVQRALRKEKKKTNSVSFFLSFFFFWCGTVYDKCFLASEQCQ